MIGASGNRKSMWLKFKQKCVTIILVAYRLFKNLELMLQKKVTIYS